MTELTLSELTAGAIRARAYARVRARTAAAGQLELAQRKRIAELNAENEALVRQSIERAEETTRLRERIAALEAESRAALALITELQADTRNDAAVVIACAGYIATLQAQRLNAAGLAGALLGLCQKLDWGVDLPIIKPEIQAAGKVLRKAGLL